MRIPKIYLICLVLLFVVGMPIWVYQTEDSIGRAHWDTTFKLNAYALGLYEGRKVVDWLTLYHGEAPGMEVMNVLVVFGLGRPEVFLKILQQIPKDKRAEILERIQFAIEDTHSNETFLKTFGQPFAAVKAQLSEQ